MIKGLKICGVSDPKTLNYILLHPNPPKFIGFITNYRKSKRFVEYEKLKKLVDVNKRDIKFIIIHYTGMQSEIASIAKLINPKYKVSCHYLINKKGEIFKMVKDNKIAWHAGRSKWKNIVNLNKYSIGIEIQNKGHFLGYQNFPNKQILTY